MCGIAGIYHFDHQRKVDQGKLKKMSDVIAHRGPDGEGFYMNGNIGLAHRRLSIIDLTSGAQPMYNDDEKIAIVFNGEIYNYIEIQKELELLGHKFRTTSDTEVIIRAYEQWGVDCQEKLNGMWSLAIWDDNKKQLFITRDRMGEKPLNFGIFDNTLLFGSEIKSINAYGIDLEPETELLELYLFLGYIPEPYTFYKGIHKLNAGHYLIVQGDQIERHKYWDLPEVDEQKLVTDQDLVTEEFSKLFYDSVRIRMRSDVAYGAFLSGGLDSSSIVAVMSKVSDKPVETFTIGFNEKKFDEREIARLVAEKFKTHHHEHVVEPDTLDEALKNVLFHYDEPFADPAAIPTGIVSAYAADEVKMVLTGDGADEVLGGYSSYQSESLVQKYQQVPGFIRKALPKLITSSTSIFSGSVRYKANRMSRVLTNFNAPFQERLISKSVKIAPASIKSLYNGNQIRIEDFVSNVFKHVHFSNSFYDMMYYNLKVSLPAQMLVKVDRMSMAHSLETRAPFLDHRIVEYMYGVDKCVKMPKVKDVKWVLKQAMRNELPAQIIDRKKKGFDVPLREWFKDDTFNSRLDQDYDQFGLNSELIKKLVAENKQGKADHGTLIWRLLVYAKWIKQF
jgi:asparagine synthase (glutamine-hydrolysing)